MFREDLKDGGKSSQLERENLTGINDEPAEVNTPVKVLTAKSIIDDKIINLEGEKLGEIKDIMLNMTTGHVEYVVLQSGGFLGIGEKLFAIPFHALELDAEKQVFVLNRPKDYIKNAPGFDKEHWPETNSKHWEGVSTYWGTSYDPLGGSNPLI